MYDGAAVAVLRTTIAIVLSLVVLFVVSTLVGIAMTLFGFYGTSLGDNSPSLGRVLVMGASGAIGVGAAKATCDGALRAYSKRAVCIAFCAVSGVGILAYVVLLVPEWDHARDYAFALATIVTSIAIFWD